jgi:hypothetical protein
MEDVDGIMRDLYNLSEMQKFSVELIPGLRDEIRLSMLNKARDLERVLEIICGR